MKDVTANLKYVYQTKNMATFCIGNCENGMETILSNFINCNDTVLVGIIGETGKQAANYIRRIGAKVHVIKSHVGKILEFNDIETHLNTFQCKVFFVVHGECSTGILQPINRFGELCHKYGRRIVFFFVSFRFFKNSFSIYPFIRYDCLFIVDVSNTLGTVELLTDKWNIDVAYANSQTVFSGLYGLVPITMNAIGLTKLEKSRVHFKSHLHDLRHIAEVWLSCDETEFMYVQRKTEIFHLIF